MPAAIWLEQRPVLCGHSSQVAQNLCCVHVCEFRCEDAFFLHEDTSLPAWSHTLDSTPQKCETIDTDRDNIVYDSKTLKRL